MAEHKKQCIGRQTISSAEAMQNMHLERNIKKQCIRSQNISTTEGSVKHALRAEHKNTVHRKAGHNMHSGQDIAIACTQRSATDTVQKKVIALQTRRQCNLCTQGSAKKSLSK